MNSFDAVRRTLVALESLSVKYVLVGALATNVYSIPRSTKDADLVVVFEAGKIRRLLNALGSDFEFNPQVMLEVPGLSCRQSEAHWRSNRRRLFGALNLPADAV